MELYDGNAIAYETQDDNEKKVKKTFAEGFQIMVGYKKRRM